MFRIASYNIRKTIGLDYRRDPLRVLGVIAQLDADIVTLQEADRRFGTRATSLPFDLIAQETDLAPLDIAKANGSIGWHGNTILVRRGMQATRIERLTLPGLEPRGAVSVDIPLANNTIRVVAVHLGLRRKDRQDQAAYLASHLAELPAMPTVLLGDFNEWNNAGSNLVALNAQLNLHQPGPSFPTLRPIAQLDRIAHSRDLAVTASAVHRCDRAARASDHLPIWADMVAVKQSEQAKLTA